MSDSETPLHGFGAVPERNTGDNMLRTAQQHHVQLAACCVTCAAGAALLGPALLHATAQTSMQASALRLLLAQKMPIQTTRPTLWPMDWTTNRTLRQSCETTNPNLTWKPSCQTK